MIFADRDYYENEYLLGRPNVIPFDQFDFYARQATEQINWRKIEVEDVPSYLANCTCEVAEALYAFEQQQKSIGVQKETVGQYSVTYDTGQENVLVEFQKQIRSIIWRWLANTSLHADFVYRGAF